MDCRYIILLGAELNGPNIAPSLERSLREKGMVCKLASDSIKLFTAVDTRTIATSGGGLIIGYLFAKDCTQVIHRLDFEGSAKQVNDHLLQNAWGNYLAVHIDAGSESEVTLLRDPSGAVSCVYSLDGGDGFITSDISLAIELGIYQKEVDWRVVAHSLNFPYLKTTRTGLKRVCELLPGDAMTCRDGAVFVASMWSPWRFVEPDTRHGDPRAAARDVKAAVCNAVVALASSEETFVVELSGGLDSSIVSSCLGNASVRARFCTLLIPISGTDERPYAKLVADSLGQQLLPLQVRFDDIRFDYGVPSSSIAPSIGLLQNTINQVWEAAGARYGASSFFSGGGGDSVFCYLKTTAPAVDAFIERGSKAGIAAIRDLSLLHQCTIWKAARLTFKKLFRKPSLDWSRDITLLNPECLALTPDRHSWMDAPAGALPGDREKIHDLIGTQLFRDMTPRGAGRAMHFPLLTQPVMEACLRVPSWMWIRDGRNRAVARDAFADLLPPGIIDRRSKGSYMSYMTAIYARDKWAMREFLEEGRLCANNLLDRPSLREFFRRELAPRDLSFLRIFDLCAAENWVRHQAQ